MSGMERYRSGRAPTLNNVPEQTKQQHHHHNHHQHELQTHPEVEEEDMSSAKLSTGTPRSDTERDELQEVEKFSQKDTTRIRMWRVVIFFVLIGTACSVTYATREVLQEDENESARSAFAKFAGTVGDAAILQQNILRDAFRTTAEAISVDATRNGIEWPYYSNPFFELYANQALNLSRALVCGFFPRVQGDGGREEWVEFANENHLSWAQGGHMIKYGNLNLLNESNYVPNITRVTRDGYIPDDIRSEYWPLWHLSPPPLQLDPINWNVAHLYSIAGLLDSLEVLRGESLLTLVLPPGTTGIVLTEQQQTAIHNQLGTNESMPHSFLITPVFQNPGNINSNIVAILGSVFSWDFSLRNLLPDNIRGVVAVISNTCDQAFTYELSGPNVTVLGEGDLHDTRFDSQMKSFDLSIVTHELKNTTSGDCRYNMKLYPSTAFQLSYNTRTPEIFAGLVAFTFSLLAIVFVVYDMLVHRRNQRLVQNAARSNAVVSSLFPGKMRDKILEQQQPHRGTKSKMKSFMVDGTEQTGSGNKPLADLFLETTIMFADITGFTAWSSVREPSQVFTLLEAVYGSFDDIAKSKKIFKVETVGDCYVAASGIPEPRRDHAASIVRFARDCINCMRKVATSLELSLGPGTAELGIRVGVHSGPVTAGVLRGERARFQLFGDTMNVTARMESSSATGRIHVSPETAELLRKLDKGHWLELRKDTVNAKGKGTMQTYWVNIKDQAAAPQDVKFESTALGLDTKLDSPGILSDDRKKNRLINWNVETLARLLKQIVARRHAARGEGFRLSQSLHAASIETSNCPLDEVKEVIVLPEFDFRAASKQVSPDKICLDNRVMEQLRSYVTTISHLYYHNPFHNFEHASHVVMSVTKLMSRIVAPDTYHDEATTGQEAEVAQSMHDHTYGITSDPLTQFACAFSALIHDVDHRGVPNTQLMIENEELGKHYRGRSVAEQNSLDLSWELLMDNQYKDLRATLCQSREELSRLRELVVNGVLATDIMDKDLKALRNDRWAKAFAKVESSVAGCAIEDRNRKATIVIEHLIQASDVAHTMQHWHVYRQWNQRLFEEMYLAYKAGRAEKDPSEFWYKGEIGFFDFYIIPLAKKLKECGVFGVSSGEYLNYAMNNRMEWERRGQEMVAEMVEALRGGSPSFRNPSPTTPL